MTSLLRCLTLALLGPAALAGQQPTFTMEQVMSAPFPDELTAAPAGGAVAWVFNTRGARNIWVAPSPDYAGRAVTAYAQDDGQEVGDLRWTPEGARLAFVSDRGDHAFVAVYDVATKTLRFLDPSVDSDAEPVWSPDGRRVAFLRIPAGSEGLPFTPQRAGQPWSIHVADVASGAARQVWIADSGPGSVFREVVAENQIRWAAGDRIVFPWEKDGWTHLYAVPVDGGRATLLTPGGFEVEHVAMSPDGATIVFSSNQDDIERRHLWKVPVTGGPPTALTRGTDLEWTPVMTGDGRGVAFIRAGTRAPPRPVILLGTAAPRDLAPGAIPVDFPEAGLVDPQPVLFPAADGMTIHGQVFLPRGLKPGDRRPAVIFFHGGSRP